MNSTNPFLNNNTILMNFNLNNINYTNQTEPINYTHQTKFSLTTKKITKVSQEKSFTDSKYNNIPRSKRSNVRTKHFFTNLSNGTNASSKSVLPSSPSCPGKFTELLSHVDINDHSTGNNKDPESFVIPKPLQGLKKNHFYPEVLTDAKKTIDHILPLLNQTAQEKNWEDLAKTLQIVYGYQRSQYGVPESIDIMQGSLEKLVDFFSKNSITTKAQFLTFKNWINIASFDVSSAIGFHNLTQAKVYLSKLAQVMSSSNEKIQDLTHSYSNALFTYPFIKRCSDDKCIVKEELLTVVEKTFHLCEKFKGKSEYYFIRNALMSFEKILQTAEDSAFKNQIIYRLEQGLENLLNKLAPEEKIIVKRLSYLTIKSIEKQNLTLLSKFCEKTAVKDIYPYQGTIHIGNMEVNLTSALDWNNDLMRQMPKKLQQTYSHFIEKFGTTLNITGQKNFKCNLYIAENKSLYEIFNYILLKKSTGNGGVTECCWEGDLCIPSAAMYKQDNEIWNLEHEFHHILLHLHAGLKVNHPMDKFGKYGRLDWLNEGLSYALVPGSFMEENVKGALTTSEWLPSIKGIIEASSQDYAISYSFVDYLLHRRKPNLDQLLVYTKEEKEDLLKKELGKLSSLESDYHDYLITRWNFPESMRRSTTTMTTTKQASIPEEYMGWTPEKGRDALKKITYGSAGLLVLGLVSLIYAIFGISKRKGGNGRGRHNRFKAERRRGYCHEPSKQSEVKPLKGKQEKRFFHNDSRSSQRPGITRV